MSSAKQLSDMNNLNATLHSVISDDPDSQSKNIPFVDDDTTNLIKESGRSSDSTSSNESFQENINYNPGRRVQLKMFRTGNDASGESDTDDNQLAMEKRDKPGPLASDLRRAEESNLSGMRRNSISMPMLNENSLDALRNLHMKACESQDNMSSSKESLDHITVSRAGLTSVLRVCWHVDKVKIFMMLLRYRALVIHLMSFGGYGIIDIIR